MNQNSHNPLRLNVGFLLKQNVGFSRKFEFDHSSVQVDDDLTIRDLNGELRLTRAAQGIYVEGTLHGTLELECARCLKPFDQVLAPPLAELFVYPAEKAEDPVLAIPETAVLDLRPLLREMMLLAIPSAPVCQADCKGLCPVCGQNRNKQDCDHPQEYIDPRLAPLKSLLGDS